MLKPIFCDMSQGGILVGTEESIFLPSLQHQANTSYISIGNRCQLHGLALHAWCMAIRMAWRCMCGVWQYARLGVARYTCGVWQAAPSRNEAAFGPQTCNLRHGRRLIRAMLTRVVAPTLKQRKSATCVSPHAGPAQSLQQQQTQHNAAMQHQQQPVGKGST